MALDSRTRHPYIVATMTARDTQTTQAPLAIGAVANRFGVSVDTIRVWEKAGKLASFRTPGGQRRFHVAAVVALEHG